MRKLNGNYIYSPSDLITFMESDYVSWMERLYFERPDAVQPDEEEETDRIIAGDQRPIRPDEALVKVVPDG